jgi:hypothetical protein
MGPLAELTVEKLCLRTRLMSIHDILHWYVRPVGNEGEPSDKELDDAGSETEGYRTIKGKILDRVKQERLEEEEACKRWEALEKEHPGEDHGAPPVRRSAHWWCVECHRESYRSTSFRQYGSFEEPLVVYCWRTDQNLQDPANFEQQDPEFVIRSEKLGSSEFTFDGHFPIPYSTRFPAIKIKEDATL